MLENNPFEIRHIEQEEQKTFVSTKVEIPLKTLINHCETKDVVGFMKRVHDNHTISLDADFFLKITEAPAKVNKNNIKLLIPMAVIFGVCIGILIFVPLYFGASFAMFAFVSLIVFFAGVSIGWVSGKQYRQRLQVLLNNIEMLVRTIRKSILGD